ncbi:MAG: primosomal protein N' [Clostridia bacterium]|nr:primosomal protein N' [Clostridia bacterium]
MFADVIVDVNHSEVDKVFEYSCPSDEIEVGMRVKVPFGNSLTEGIVIALKNSSNFPESKVKSIISVIESPVLTDETLALTEFMRKKYYCTRASVLRLFLPSEMRKGKIKEKFISKIKISRQIFENDFEALGKTAKKQREALLFLACGDEFFLSEITEKFGTSAIKGLNEKGLVTVFKVQNVRSPYKQLSGEKKSVSLTESQKNAVFSVLNTDKMTTLLFGVTGSGKTEVYLSLIEKALSEGKTAIMLVPEIALTPQMLKQLRARFSDGAAILHSGLSAGERFDEWWRIKNGDARVVIGARSAIFAPAKDVGVIIIDEEHDGSYLSESVPRYDTIEVAQFRANFNNAKLVLGSATPSIDSFLKAQNGEYNLAELPERINKKPLPEVEFIDMRKEVRRGNSSYFSSALKDELEKCLKDGNQAMIFLNQRGYSKTVVCTECGHVQKCPNCDVSLTYHKEDNSLLCHYCGAKFKMISACTECGSKFLRYGNAGTERIVDELKKLFPTAKILRMDRDTTQTKEGHFSILSAFSEKKADILVGTQMIAKGHDFPFVSLVGILDADQSLHFSDYRSAERTFQLLTQVAGRSGRADVAGKVVLQTYSPDNPVLRQAIKYDYLGFFKNEISVRKATSFPPFTDIIRILFSAVDDQKVVEATKGAYNELSVIHNNEKEKFRFFGAMKSPIKRLQNKYRYQILMRITKDDDTLKDRIYAISQKYASRNVLVSFEVNSNNLS